MTRTRIITMFEAVDGQYKATIELEQHDTSNTNSVVEQHDTSNTNSVESHRYEFILRQTAESFIRNSLKEIPGTKLDGHESAEFIRSISDSLSKILVKTFEDGREEGKKYTNPLNIEG